MNAVEAHQFLTELRTKVRTLERGSRKHTSFSDMIRLHRQKTHPIPDKLAERQRRAERLASLAEDGRICIVSSGMDCDGCRWSGRVYEFDAIPFAVERFIEKEYEWADGPLRLELASPSECEEVEYESRDLALEAFEDGHPHCLYY